MAFVNEYISNDDVEKYRLKEIDAKAPAATINSRDWTIDRDRDIYLRVVAYGRDELSGTSTWTFFWKGTLLWFKKEGATRPQAPGSRRGKLSIIKKFMLPENLQLHRAAIHEDLRQAFRVYGGGGVFASGADYVHEIQFDEGDAA